MSRLLNSIGKRFNRNNNGSKHENQSVSDYADKKSLIAALMRGAGAGAKPRPSEEASSAASTLSGEDLDLLSFAPSSDIEPVEWKLPLVDEQASDPQTMEEEAKRLLDLQSYFILDSAGEEDFDRITRLGSILFNTPMCMVSLVDLGRQWFLSRVGTDATETPRKHAFCAHVVINKYKLLIVPDATKDFRFKDNPLVTGPMQVRFYAGAALVSPEGFKLGSFCVVSSEARPEGLTSKEQEILHELANMVVSSMVARRNRHIKEEYENQLDQVMKTFLETKEKLDVAKDSLEYALLRSSMDIDKESSVALTATIDSIDLQSKMCAAAVRNIVQDRSVNVKKTTKGKEGRDFFEVSFDEYDAIVNPTTSSEKLFENINKVVANFPMNGVVTVEIDKSVPRNVGVEDLLLFRATLNLLTHCMGATPAGCTSGLKIRKKDSEDELLVQCVQGGEPISKSAAKELFTNKDSLLAPVASIVRSMGGHYGMYEARWNPQGGPMQSIYWFQIPFEASMTADAKPSSRLSALNRNLMMTHKPKNGVEMSLTAEKAKDPFYATLIDTGCVSAKVFK